jgi:hypothetical protein
MDSSTPQKTCDRLLADECSAAAQDFNALAQRFFSGLAQMMPQHQVAFQTAARSISMAAKGERSFVTIMCKFESARATVDGQDLSVGDLIQAQNPALFTHVLPDVATHAALAAQLLPLCMAWDSISDASRRNIWTFLTRMRSCAQRFATATAPVAETAAADLTATVKRGEAYVQRYLAEHGSVPNMMQIAAFMRTTQ